MKYRNDRYGTALSILGYGCMRFPQKIEIRRKLQEAGKVPETPIYRVARKAVSLFMRY